MNRKMKKRLAGIAGIALLLLLLLFANSWVGNPVSNMLARNAAEQYIAGNYSGLDLQIQRSGYNFKDGAYGVFVKAEGSQDIAFSIYADSFGNIVRDNYEFEVANHFTTWRRLDEELRAAGREMLIGRLDYDFDHAMLSFVMNKEGNEDMMDLEQDMELDIYNPPLPLVADVTLFSDELSYRKMAEVAKDLEAEFARRDVPISQYSVRLLPMSAKPEKEGQAVSWVDALSVSEFPAERLNDENLPLAMERFEKERVEAYNEKYPK